MMKDYTQIKFAGLLAVAAVSSLALLGSAALAQQPLVPPAAPKAEAPLLPQPRNRLLRLPLLKPPRLQWRGWPWRMSLFPVSR
jgi:hypothetical protein